MRRPGNVGWMVVLGVMAVLAGMVSLRGEPPSSTRSTRSTRPTTIPDVVMLDQLNRSGLKLYQPVPFAHRRHAEMAETWNGCTTCHHHTPNPTTASATQAGVLTPHHAPSQDDAAAIPACRSCHAIAADKPAIHMPSLKGAYHRQCLNCHREWMEANACVICHAARPAAGEAAASTAPAPTPDDIVGRMHKPIPEPGDRLYVARFTPVAGPNVLFRHEEHVKGFGIKCAACHRRDTCADCHTTAVSAAETAPATSAAPAAAPTTMAMVAATPGPRPLRPGRTWRETHVPCVSCHQDDRCINCHYGPEKPPPPTFAHPMTGQTLDAAHVKLACGQCHSSLKDDERPVCGAASCHKRTVSFPRDRPGPFVAVATAPSTQAAATPVAATQAAASQPATRPVLIRIRRGGS